MDERDSSEYRAALKASEFVCRVIRGEIIVESVDMARLFDALYRIRSWHESHGRYLGQFAAAPVANVAVS